MFALSGKAHDLKQQRCGLSVHTGYNVIGHSSAMVVIGARLATAAQRESIGHKRHFISATVFSSHCRRSRPAELPARQAVEGH
jgi:hypothetical protein